MASDVVFEHQLKEMIAAVKANSDLRWAKPVLNQLVSQQKAFASESKAAHAAENAWHKKVGAKKAVVERAEAGVRRIVGHLKADLSTDDLRTLHLTYDSSAGLDETLDTLIEALADGSLATLPYAKDSLGELQDVRGPFDDLIAETYREWTAWRAAAAKKNAARAKAWETFKRARRHLRADLGPSHPDVQRVKTKKKPRRKAAPQ